MMCVVLRYVANEEKRKYCEGAWRRKIVLRQEEKIIYYWNVYLIFFCCFGSLLSSDL